MFDKTELYDSIDLSEIVPMAYTFKGYDIFPSPCHDVVDRLNHLDDFLTTNAYDVYCYSPLQDELESITLYLDDDVSENDVAYNKALAIEKYIITEVLQYLSPDGYEYRMSDDKTNYGLYSELPRVLPLIKGTQEERDLVLAITNSSIFTKLLFIDSNKEHGQLRNTSVSGLNNLCLSIASEKHFTSFSSVVKRRATTHNMGEALTHCRYDTLTWVIETLFFDNYKDDIDRYLGSDLTRLWEEIARLAYDTPRQIDGIDMDDVYGLRETCSECEELEVDTERYSNKQCSCETMEGLNNVWAIKDSYFFKALQQQGAMVYETDSLYLYMQTDYSGYYYDTLLRKAWLSMHPYITKPVLEKSYRGENE